jgi:hypothetical protein
MINLGYIPWGATAVTIDGDTYGGPPEIGMAYSDDGGMSYHQRMYRSLGRAGEWNVQVRWQRLGMGRDRIMDLTWNHPCVQNLTTAFLSQPEPVLS